MGKCLTYIEKLWEKCAEFIIFNNFLRLSGVWVQEKGKICITGELQTFEILWVAVCLKILRHAQICMQVSFEVLCQAGYLQISDGCL